MPSLLDNLTSKKPSGEVASLDGISLYDRIKNNTNGIVFFVVQDSPKLGIISTH
jgi:hypothetical protein